MAKSDSKLVGTPNHPFWSVTRQAWVEMGRLQPSERLLLADGSEAVVETLEREYAPAVFENWTPGQAAAGTLGTPADPATGTFTTYNFEVADWHTYFVTDAGAAVWVHNAGNLCPTLLEDAATRYKNLGVRGDRFLETGQRMGKFTADDVKRIKDVAAGGVLKNNALGNAHADDVARQIEAAGGKVVGREITVRTPLGDRRLDIVAELPNGKVIGIEAKHGGAKLSPGQTAKDNAIRAGTGEFVGEKAREFKLTERQVNEVLTWR
ncbi:MAG: hypothetical protein ICCCNLDF_01664 [Planctomycetes bacterium]|nr:hypothetical protein [Planctomycetota bacterium]